jgi:glutathione S-transferase
MTPITDPSLRWYALAASAVAVHLFTLAGITGYVRATRKTFINPEDAALNKGKQADDDHPDVQRVKRAHINLMESAIPFFAIGWLYVVTGASDTGAKAYFGTFVGARILHSIFYMLGKQPLRTITFAIGVFAVVGMLVHVVQASI